MLSAVISFLIISTAFALLDTNPPANPIKLIFIHHSTGQAWLADGHGELGIALRDNNYFVSDTNYGWGPGTIGDHTDIGHWHSWFRGGQSSNYLSSLFAESGQHCSYSRMTSGPTGENKVVMFKSCYPNSDFDADSGTIPPIGSNPLVGQSCGGSSHTVSNAKGIYVDLLEYFKTRQDKLFIAIAAPPLVSSSSGDEARRFNQWLTNTSNGWLANYPYGNVVAWDYYNVLTAAGAHHRVVSGLVDHRVVSGQNLAHYPSGSGDSHPNAEGDAKATAEFLPWLNGAVNRWLSAGSSGIADPWPSGIPPSTEDSAPTSTGAFFVVMLAVIAACM